MIKTLINSHIIVYTVETIPLLVVFPAEAGNQFKLVWMPAFAGMTNVNSNMRPSIIIVINRPEKVFFINTEQNT
jgi:hypothetical protein